MFSSPFIEERLYLNLLHIEQSKTIILFSSPFIEERLYFGNAYSTVQPIFSSRPLLSRSGCIYYYDLELSTLKGRSRPLLSRSGCISTHKWTVWNKQGVLVPFYRGAVVFSRT